MKCDSECPEDPSKNRKKRSDVITRAVALQASDDKHAEFWRRTLFLQMNWFEQNSSDIVDEQAQDEGKARERIDNRSETRI
jgi:hypothetical protein